MSVTNMPSAEALISKARELIPQLRDNADHVEELRSVPTETIQLFKDCGFFKILQPRQWGGYGMNPEVFYRVLMELGRGCPSSAWCLMILGIHQWEFGKMDPQAGNEVWGEDNSILVASSYAPLGKARKVEGGWMLSGRWPTASGSDHAAGGAFLGARIFDEEGNFVDYRSFLARRENYELIDDWHVVGLAGTGSKSLVLKEEVFIPEHRSHSIADYTQPEGDLSYKLPFNQIFFGAVSSVIVGFAQGMVDLFVEHMKPRVNVFVGGPVAAQNPFVQEKLGNAVLMIRSARARLLVGVQESTQSVEQDGLVSIHDRVHYFLDIQGVAKDCFGAGHMLFKKSSARGVFLSNPMQRQMRALLVAANHITQNEDDTSALLGSYLLDQGLPPGLFELPATL
ncbi:acyl-CoA dehydrogenase family protein [Oceanobacter antarcticus]|uniref:Acyl-CoA dehydrogenase family protein n=1 Tax=Oceanobacter antarcticus TaxID=3133425 RepID=A0ABW8NNY1_9GAMM